MVDSATAGVVLMAITQRCPGNRCTRSRGMAETQRRGSSAMQITNGAKKIVGSAAITAALFASPAAALASQPARWPTSQIPHFKVATAMPHRERVAIPQGPEHIALTGTVTANHPQTFCSKAEPSKTATVSLDSATVNGHSLDVAGGGQLSTYLASNGTLVLLQLSAKQAPVCMKVSTWLPRATVRLRLTAYS